MNEGCPPLTLISLLPWLVSVTSKVPLILTCVMYIFGPWGYLGHVGKYGAVTHQDQEQSLQWDRKSIGSKGRGEKYEGQTFSLLTQCKEHAKLDGCLRDSHVWGNPKEVTIWI
jgi:hypothetical protein